MRPKQIIIILLGTITTFTLFAQSGQTYRGNYATQTMNGSAVYGYYDNSEGERIYDGNFMFNSPQLTKPAYGQDIYYGNIVGQFKDNHKSGEWRYVRVHYWWNVTTKQVKDNISETIMTSYKNGKLDGMFEYIVKTNKQVVETTCNAQFIDGKLAGKFTYKSTKNNLNAEGQFDSDVYMDGLWITTYREGNGVMWEVGKTYRAGALLKHTKKDMSIGESIVVTDNTNNKFWTNYSTEHNRSIVENSEGHTESLKLKDVERKGDYHYGILGSWFPEDLYIRTVLYRGNNLLYDVVKGSQKEPLIIYREIGYDSVN